MQLLNEQYSFLYSDYDKTQLKNNRIHLMRQKEIREKIPAYRRLEEEMRDMSVLMDKIFKYIADKNCT